MMNVLLHYQHVECRVDRQVDRQVEVHQLSLFNNYSPQANNCFSINT